MTSAFTIPADLNEGQIDAYKKIVDFILRVPTGEMFLLEGYAGTGKTFLVSKVLEFIKSHKKYWNIAVTAPTNKAVKVLKRSSITKNKSVEYLTIHKLLGLKEEITAEGKQKFVNDTNTVIDIDIFSVLILDEVSMLNDELFIELQKYSRRLKIIFLGDPAQIPPVNKVDCIPFLKEGQEKYNISVALLTQIMRQKEGNPIIESSFNIRQNLTIANIEIAEQTTLNEQDKGIVVINPGRDNGKDVTLAALNYYFTSDEFKNNSDHAKVIAWRNVTIDRMNTLIRGMIFGGEVKKVMKGEKMIANKPIVYDNGIVKSILFTTSDEFEIKEFELRTDKQGFKFYDCSVEWFTISGQRVLTNDVRILHEDSEAHFNKTLLALKNAAINEKNFYERKGKWKSFYSFMRLFADVGYNYAITGHKSQGSTYKNVFILEDDINQNKNIVERNRIKYTCCTRPTDKLYIIKR